MYNTAAERVHVCCLVRGGMGACVGQSLVEALTSGLCVSGTNGSFWEGGLGAVLYMDTGEVVGHRNSFTGVRERVLGHRRRCVLGAVDGCCLVMA